MRDELLSWRQRLEWTQREAASFLDVPVSTYRGWEQGRREVHNPGPVRRLLRLAYFQHNAQDIIDRTS